MLPLHDSALDDIKVSEITGNAESEFAHLHVYKAYCFSHQKVKNGTLHIKLYDKRVSKYLHTLAYLGCNLA